MSSQLNSQDVLSVLKGVLPSEKQIVALHEPLFRGDEWLYTKECLDTGWVSSVGKFVDRFEQNLADFTGVNYAVAVINGTAALHICLKVLEVKPEDEVLIPTLTFIATANAVVYCGAIPHFIDSELKTLGMDPLKLDDYLKEIAEVRGENCFNKLTGRRIQAVIPMHTFGHPVDIEKLFEVCRRYKITMIEDAAESIGSTYKGKHTGNFGSVTALSFNGNKIITTGGGGAILTNSEQLGKLAKHLTTTAKVPHPYEFSHDMVGYNYRMPNINAAIGCAQLEQLPLFLKMKRLLADKYKTVFEDIKGIDFFIEPKNSKSNYWLNVLILDEENASMRNDLLKLMNDNSIQSRPVWTLMHKLPMFTQCPHMDLSFSENIARRLINIPSSAVLGEVNA